MFSGDSGGYLLHIQALMFSGVFRGRFRGVLTDFFPVSLALRGQPWPSWGWITPLVSGLISFCFPWMVLWEFWRISFVHPGTDVLLGFWRTVRGYLDGFFPCFSFYCFAFSVESGVISVGFPWSVFWGFWRISFAHPGTDVLWGLQGTVQGYPDGFFPVFSNFAWASIA